MIHGSHVIDFVLLIDCTSESVVTSLVGQSRILIDIKLQIKYLNLLTSQNELAKMKQMTFGIYDAQR